LTIILTPPPPPPHTHTHDQFTVMGEAVDEEGTVWLNLNLASPNVQSALVGPVVPDSKDGVWVEYCTSDFAPFLRKQTNAMFKEMFDKSNYLMRLRRPSEMLEDEVDLSADPFSNSLYSRLMAAREVSSEVTESEALARKLSVREGSVPMASDEPLRTRSFGSMGAAGASNKWAKVRSEIQTSSVALRDVLRGDSIGMELLTFLHSHVTVADATKISRQRIACLERRLKAINNFAHLLVSSSSVRSVHTVLWALSRINTTPLEISSDASAPRCFVMPTRLPCAHISYLTLLPCTLIELHSRLSSRVNSFSSCIPTITLCPTLGTPRVFFSLYSAALIVLLTLHLVTPPRTCTSSVITLKTMAYSPLSEFSDDSPATMRLRHAFHRLLSIVLDFMRTLPPHHPVLHAALRYEISIRSL
jgi:hypothetical protein